MRSRKLIAGAAIAAALAGGAAGASPAGASTAGIDAQGVLRYTGAASESNHVRVYFDMAYFVYVIYDSGATSTTVTGRFCNSYGPQITYCAAGKFTSVDVQLGNGGGWAQNDLTLTPVTLRAGAGTDTLIAGPGPTLTQLVGGTGTTTMQGRSGPAGYQGGPGADVVLARNQVAEQISCAGGADSVEADADDTVAPDCETVTRPETATPSTETPADDPVEQPPLNGDLPGVITDAPAPVEISQAPVTLLPQNRVPVGISCPETSAGGCEGVVKLGMLKDGHEASVVAARRRPTSRKPVRGRKFRLAAGEKAVVPVKLSRRVARSLRGRRRAKLRVTVTVRTEAGVKTVTDTITVKARRRAITKRSRRK